MFQIRDLRILPLLLLLMLPSLAAALDSDSRKTIKIIADSWVYNYRTGTNVYEGNVRVDQGTTHITADRLITRNNDQHKIQEATAFGLQSLAHYWTLPKEGDPVIHARAKVIRFYPLESNVTLEQKVDVLQGKNSFQGELIHYNSKEQTITVPATKNGRAVLVYNPDK